jgi:hypothetical protein
MTKIVGLLFLAGTVFAQTTTHSPVDPNAAIVQDFQKRVAGYLQLRKSIESNLPKLKATSSQEKISHHGVELRHAVREARKDAQPGEVFTPEISAEIRRLIAIAMHPDGPEIRQSLRSAEPVQLHLAINEKYPDGVPLQTTPPSLLENLPALPPEIEYRITGQDLVLLDAKANLVIDIIRGVFS